MRIAVIGAGSWGTALANLLAGKGEEVILWAYEADLVARLQATAVNDLFLPGIELDRRLRFTNDLAAAVAGREVVVLVSPSQVMRPVVTQLRPHLLADSLLVSAAKGIENDTLLLMSEVLAEVLGPAAAGRCAYLSGPSFAREVAVGLPTAVTVAALEAEVGRTVQELFRTDFFRVYTNADVVGVELGGALKNVIALAAGVSDGLGFGHNARAALINRGLVEMARLGAAKGAEAETFAGLAGMGDLVLTCTGDLSRNRSVGIELGKGRKLAEILGGMRMVAEGVKTTLSAWQLAQKLGVAMPITEQMYRILYEDKSPRQAVTELMQRQQRSERSGR
jgi:glycerol-3-phosphate dehydrogenase (NAD(P)+)